METQFILKNIEKLNLAFEVGKALDVESLDLKEQELDLKFPEQFRIFYLAINGLLVEDPPLRIYSLSELEKDGSLLAFAEFNESHLLALETDKLNVAGQWTVVNKNTGFEVTLTFASFWSNKMFAWLRSRREIWEKEVYS
ncbi:SMI1/KNR4 family protein [Teredinibacter turnerae]|uniref:SMI1/KNR4 family protein n=1 Tax=Teredinibacter turnerae TaxID=2426 RepID=UPI0030D559CE